MDSLGTRVGGGGWWRIFGGMGVWINTVTVTGKWGVAGGGGSRREKAEKRRVAERLELRVWEGEEFSLH